MMGSMASIAPSARSTTAMGLEDHVNNFSSPSTATACKEGDALNSPPCRHSRRPPPSLPGFPFTVAAPFASFPRGHGLLLTELPPLWMMIWAMSRLLGREVR
ncbi:hypothetical protein VPH35_125826 [Triticum aestivum]